MREGGVQISWRQPANCVSLGRAQADSPSPRNGSKHPLSENGSRNIPRFFQTGDGECLDRENMMVLCIEERRRRSGGFAIATEAERDAGNPHSRKTGRKLNGCLGNSFQPKITNTLK